MVGVTLYFVCLPDLGFAPLLGVWGGCCAIFMVCCLRFAVEVVFVLIGFGITCLLVVGFGDWWFGFYMVVLRMWLLRW